VEDRTSSPLRHDKEVPEYEWFPCSSVSANCAINTTTATATTTTNNDNNKTATTKMASPTATIGVRTTCSICPIFTYDECQLIRQAAQELWDDARTKVGHHSQQLSRFTYQYSSNQECHVSDFARTTTATTASDNGRRYKPCKSSNQALQAKLYPLIRTVFPLEQSNTALFIYDALVIRYNATNNTRSNSVTAATTVATNTDAGVLIGAGQPLHRDLGLVSVNIMLNSPHEFQGGGTFFEDQLRIPLNREPIKPIDVGHAILHASSLRHAGAATTKGTRDILVFFVSAKQQHQVTQKVQLLQVPPQIASARLKTLSSITASCRKRNLTTSIAASKNLESLLWFRIRKQRLALKFVPNDGEAFQYLGTALMEYAAYVRQQQQEQDVPNSTVTADSLIRNQRFLKAAVNCLYQAQQFTPCDARVYNNLGIALPRYAEVVGIEATTAAVAERRGVDNVVVTAATLIHEERKQQQERLQQQAEEAYRHGYQLLKLFQEAGCNHMEQEVQSLVKNFGLFLAKQDRWEDAMHTMEVVALVAALGYCKVDDDNKQKESDKKDNKTVNEIYELYNYCQKRLSRDASNVQQRKGDD